MRHLLGILTFLAIQSVAVFAASQSFAMPVFLRPDSRFATGNQARTKLEERTHKIQIQRWFRVQTKDKVYGWIAEDHALTALKLVEQATLTEDTPARVSADLDSASGRPMIKKSTSVLILEITGSWARVQPFPVSEFTQAWIPTEKLSALISAPGAQRAFIYQTAALYADSLTASRKITTIDEGTYVQVLRMKGQWLEVQSGRFQGFVKRSDAWTAEDLGEKGIRAAISLAPLRAAALPYAELIRSLSYSSTLTLVTAATLRWGQALTREQGLVWWPMSDELVEHGIADIALKLPTSEVFSRKIYDMASSRATPSLKFISADGVFRTVDGSLWTRIPIFRDQNYPIAVAKSGSVFIGPYLSDDQGETFQQWIRWDALVSSLSKNRDIAPKNLKILEIRPEDPAGRKVTLRVTVGVGDPVRVATDDQGLSWRTY